MKKINFVRFMSIILVALLGGNLYASGDDTSELDLWENEKEIIRRAPEYSKVIGSQTITMFDEPEFYIARYIGSGNLLGHFKCVIRNKKVLSLTTGYTFDESIHPDNDVLNITLGSICKEKKLTYQVSFFMSKIPEEITRDLPMPGSSSIDIYDLTLKTILDYNWSLLAKEKLIDALAY